MTPFIKNMPKVELHMHIEGSMMPEMLLQLAEKNKISLPFHTLEEVHQAYQFEDLEAFVNLYIKGTEVIRTAEDFYHLTMQYLQRCHEENIRHAEVFCDTRTYVDRGLPGEMVLDGIEAGFADAQKQWGISGGMLPSFIRHLGPEKAHEDWQFLKQHSHRFLGVGLAAVEVGFPASLFKDVFAEVRDSGLRVVAHAGEEGPAEYIWSAINDIRVDRIDHGIRCLDDPELVAYLREQSIPLTVCPCSNVSLHVFKEMAEHVLPEMLRQGLNVTINSDDPAHFDAFLSDNMLAVQQHCGISDRQLADMSHNAIQASFATAGRKAELSNELIAFTEKQGI